MDPDTLKSRVNHFQPLGAYLYTQSIAEKRRLVAGRSREN